MALQPLAPRYGHVRAFVPAFSQHTQKLHQKYLFWQEATNTIPAIVNAFSQRIFDWQVTSSDHVICLAGAFLIAYIVMIILIGIPLLLLEFSFGQYFGTGSLSIFRKVCPIFQGEHFIAGINNITRSVHNKVTLIASRSSNVQLTNY